MPTTEKLVVNDQGEYLGRVVEDAAEPAGKRRATRFSDLYITLFLPGQRRHMRAELSGTDYRVLFCYWLHSEYTGDAWHTDHTVVARELTISIKAVQASVTRLVNCGALSRPRRGYLAFNPKVAWRGGAGKREQILQAES